MKGSRALGGALFDGTAFCGVPLLFSEGDVKICITLSPGGVGWGCFSGGNRYLCID